MKSHLFLLCILLGCTPNREKLKFYPEPPSDSRWTSYEGKVPLDDHRSLIIELNLQASANPAEGRYQLYEYIDDGTSLNAVSELDGGYSSFEEEGKVVVQLHNSALGNNVKRSYYAKNEKGDTRFQEETLRAVDLSLLRINDETFSVLATTFAQVSENPNDQLYKRTSAYFTIEGYFRHTGDSADFFEMNTEHRWAITKMGAYGSAIQQYHELAYEKFQPVYLKGIGFTIHRPDKNGATVEALVIKKLLQMSSVDK
jgi:hypothetical protein